MRLSSMDLYAAKNLLHYQAESYAKDISKSQDIDFEEAEAIALKQMQSLLNAETLPENELFYDILDDHDQNVGICWLTHRSDNMLFISYIEIHADHRGKGHAKAAMQAIEAVAKERGVKQIWLHVFAHNQTAQHVYQKAGYTCSGIQMFKKI